MGSRTVAPDEIRRIFNEERIWERVQEGEFTEVVVYSEEPADPRRYPPGTRSERIRYLDRQGRQKAEVHQYTKRDGSLAASGRPDPKILYHRGELLIATTQPPPLRP